jgi:anti-sigma factor RsiW
MTALRHLTDSELAGYLDEDLPAGERTRVEEHLEDCDACRAELVATARLLAPGWDQSAPPDAVAEPEPLAGPEPTVPGGPEGPGLEAPAHGGRSRWRVPGRVVGLAAAAGLAALLLVRQDQTPAGQPGSERERLVTEGVDRLVVHAPPEAGAVARRELRFTWADHGTGSYRITVTAEDGRLVWSQTLADTTIAPPAALELDAGQRYFWYVDAIRAGVIARTGAHSFLVTP